MSTYDLEIADGGVADAVVVLLAGELDLTNAREVEERLIGSVRNGSKLVLDVNRVSFIDSAALHVLFRLSRLLGRGMVTVVVEPTAPVARTLDIVGVPDVMTVASTAGLPDAGSP